MLRDEIAPRLRAVGLRGSGSAYLLPDADRWLIVGFQKHPVSRADCVEFTVNLVVASKLSWAEDRDYEPSLPIRPGARYAGNTVNVVRLGELMPPRGDDRWWRVAPTRPTRAVATRVGNAIEHLAIPWLRTARTPNPAKDINER